MRIEFQVDSMKLIEGWRTLYVALTLPFVGTLWIQRWPRYHPVWTWGWRTLR